MKRPWAMSMRWLDLLFAHWPVSPAVLRPLLPPGLELDLFDGKAYVGVVPFRMEGVTPRGVPEVPGLHAFPELNLRTYVTTGGRPGVWFFSLDAGQKLAVRVARALFHLPYFDAAFRLEGNSYSSIRTHAGAPPAILEATYMPTGPVYHAKPGTLEHWLTERYCLYSADKRGRIYRGEIAHTPWPLQPAAAEFRKNTLGDWLGIAMQGPPETLHFAKELDVRAWLVQRIEPR